MYKFGVTTAEAVEAACRIAELMLKLDTETEIACIKRNPSIGFIGKIRLIRKIRKMEADNGNMLKTKK